MRFLGNSRPDTLKPGFYKRVLIWAICLPIIGANAVLGLHVHELASRRAQIKEDYSEVNSFMYGLLSVDAWKDVARKIVVERIEDFKLNPAQRKILEKEIGKVLVDLLSEAEKMIEEKDKGLLGGIKKHFALSYLHTFRDNVPRLSETVTQRIQDPSTLRKLKTVALLQFEKYAEATHSSKEDVTTLKRILAKNNVSNVDQFNAAAEREIFALDAETYRLALMMIGCTLLFLIAWWPLRRQPDLYRPFFGLSALFALVVLVTALSIPMMEVDARMARVDFTFLGENIRFSEQILYYRSKSLMQIVTSLFESRKPDSMGVAVLLMLFSVLFPIAKLTCAQLYLLGSERMKRSKLVFFFAFKSSKWSMSDVLVVAIFMAYIGFDSILSNRLSTLSMQTSAVKAISTNASSTQPGFLLFATFVLYSMALSGVLSWIAGRRSDSKDLAELGVAKRVARA